MHHFRDAQPMIKQKTRNVRRGKTTGNRLRPGPKSQEAMCLVCACTVREQAFEIKRTVEREQGMKYADPIHLLIKNFLLPKMLQPACVYVNQCESEAKMNSFFFIIVLQDLGIPRIFCCRCYFPVSRESGATREGPQNQITEAT